MTTNSPERPTPRSEYEKVLIERAWQVFKERYPHVTRRPRYADALEEAVLAAVRECQKDLY